MLLKTNQKIQLASAHTDIVIEQAIHKKDAELKELADKNAKHFAKRNLPLPTGDKLSHYTEEIKYGYEGLVAFVYQQLQPSVRFPESKIDADFIQAKIKQLEEEIQQEKNQNNQDEYEYGDTLKNFDSKNVSSRMKTAVILTIPIGIGEIVFNTKAFEVTGENLLFALLLSIGISSAIFVFAHLFPMIYKETKDKTKRNLILFGSPLLATLVFIALAVFRSQLLEKHEVTIQPVWFVIINLFLFTVTAFLSYRFMPSKEELKEHQMLFKRHQVMEHRKQKIEQCKTEIESMKYAFIEKTKQWVRITYCAEYCVERIKKMYSETIGLFKSTNLSYRTDKQIPDCFHNEVSEMNTNSLTIYSSFADSNKK